jgi:hypothetical protein
MIVTSTTSQNWKKPCLMDIKKVDTCLHLLHSSPPWLVMGDEYKENDFLSTYRVNAKYGGSLLVSQWWFLLGTLCSKAYSE